MKSIYNLAEVTRPGEGNQCLLPVWSYDTTAKRDCRQGRIQRVKV